MSLLTETRKYDVRRDLSRPTVFFCRKCGVPVPFYSSAIMCLNCGAWSMIVDSLNSRVEVLEGE